MRRRKLAETMDIPDPQVKARVLAVLQALTGEKPISEICRETGLKPVQYYKLESQILKGMALAAQATLAGGRKRSPLLDSADLEERNRRLRQDNQRISALLRLTRKLFKMGRKSPKTRVYKGRRPAVSLPPKPETIHPAAPHSIKEA